VLLSRIIPEQGITTDSFDSSSSWIGSKRIYGEQECTRNSNPIIT
jgi:hypothetical protein